MISTTRAGSISHTHARTVAVIAIVAALVWSFWHAPFAWQNVQSHALIWLTIAALYLSAHLLRMMRLAVLSLDAQLDVAPLALMHGLTAFLGLLIPFKLGELLRLASFCAVVNARKAWVIWLCERAADVLLILLLLVGLSLSGQNLPPFLQRLLMILLFLVVFAVSTAIALNSLLRYWKRDLIVNSLSTSSLRTLEFSQRYFEFQALLRSVLEGRSWSLACLTVAIWAAELNAAVSVLGMLNQQDYLRNLGQSLFVGLQASDTLQLQSYVVIQQLTTVLLMVASAFALWRVTRTKKDLP